MKDPHRPALPAPHYLNLPGARTVTTQAMQGTADVLHQALAHRHLVCVTADPGVGKTFTLHTLSHRLPQPPVLWLLLRPQARPDDLRHGLHRALGLPGTPPKDPGICDDYLRHTLGQAHHLLILDEAHQLSPSCIEYLRYLHDDPAPCLTIVLLASRPRLRALRSHPTLLNRIATWHQLDPLAPDEIPTALPDFHAAWRGIPPVILSRLDSLWAHGNFRRWAALTHQLHSTQHRHPGTVPDPEKLLQRLHPTAT